MSHKNQNRLFAYFSVAGLLLLLRSKIADQFGSYYWNAIYHTDMLVIAILMWGISRALTAKWQRYIVDTYVGFIIGDFVDRVWFKNTFVTRYDLIAILLAVLIPLITYLIDNGKRRSNISKN